MRNMSQFDGDPCTTIDHITKLIEHASKMNVVHLDNLIELFIASIGYEHRGWLDSCEPQSISSFVDLINKFMKYKGQKFQSTEAIVKS